MHTDKNISKIKETDTNQFINITNSIEKIKIKKDLFNINNENIKYNSLRNGNNGKIYFGYEKDIVNNKFNLDYLLMPKDNEYHEKFEGIQFKIEYDKNKLKYFIKDLGSGYGTFIILKTPLRIINNLLISIGYTFIFFFLSQENENLSLKLLTGDEQSEVYEYLPEQKIITVGRDKSSDIFNEDKLLSRKQCYIYCQRDEKDKIEWFIKDGDINGKKSANDTWMYCFKDTFIYDQMIFNI